ncbi:hypothetical protein PGT21_014554 [Puccinia graminis f. sp. tritici]|uniref:Uncharacterized protein n=1 Tax=Puccinia graminis f. sp. tritici TaxID=56615 RepID=A0A5B0QFJ0_PUCGR|nr:hypothetical protein PGT21_014554 [Puccinia graminis f. sp. tritici]
MLVVVEDEKDLRLRWHEEDTDKFNNPKSPGGSSGEVVRSSCIENIVQTETAGLPRSSGPVGVPWGLSRVMHAAIERRGTFCARKIQYPSRRCSQKPE